MKRFVIIIVLIFLCLAVIVNAKASEFQITSNFELSFVNISDENIDLSGIIVNIYSSQKTNNNDSSIVTEYSNTYEYSLQTDKNGRAVFARPSDNFLIEIAKESLPESLYAERCMEFYHQDQSSGIIKLSDASFQNKNNDTAEATNTSAVSSGYDSIISNVLRAVESNKIDAYAALKRLLDIYEQLGESTELIKAVSELRTRTDVYNKLTNEEIETVRAITAAPSYNQYYISGNFEIRYTASSSSPVPTFVLSLASALNQAESSLITGLSLSRPESNIYTHRYHFYVTSASSDYEAYTIPEINVNGERTAYSVFPNISSTLMGSTLSTYKQGTAAHEYMHAIIHKYRNSGDLGKWFKEAWCNWAGVRLVGLGATNASSVNNYLSHTDYCLTFDNDAYGKFLLPLYISQNHGGDATVAEVVKKLSDYNNIITAIDNALPGTNTFASIFANYMRYNYAPKEFYTTHSNSWSDKPKISETYGSNFSISISNLSINPLAADYRDFGVGSGGVYKYTICVDGCSSGLVGRLILTRTTGGFTNYNLGTETVQNTHRTYEINIHESDFESGCLMFVNRNVNAAVEISVATSKTIVQN